MTALLLAQTVASVQYLPPHGSSTGVVCTHSDCGIFALQSCKDNLASFCPLSLWAHFPLHLHKPGAGETGASCPEQENWEMSLSISAIVFNRERGKNCSVPRQNKMMRNSCSWARLRNEGSIAGLRLLLPFPQAESRVRDARIFTRSLHLEFRDADAAKVESCRKSIDLSFPHVAIAFETEAKETLVAAFALQYS